MGGVVRAIASVGLIVVGVVTGNPAAIIAGVGGLIGAVSGGGGGQAKPPAQAGRLQATIDPGTPRKMLFGITAMATDVRYQAFTGTDQEYYHQIVCCASHKVTSIDELWLDQELAWSSASGIATKFSGYLTVTAILEGSSANAVNVDGNWNAANGCRLTGCAYVWIKYKRTGATKDSDSPFASSITTRMTIVGKGMPVYDARFDSTRGGSGTMRADDQTTWGFTYGGTEIGRNPAAQIGAFMLGWKIGGKLAVGCGMPANRIDWSRMITAANTCDESVTLAAGGTEPRYRTDLLTGEGDERGTAFALWKESCCALLRDAGGKIAFDVLVNDLSTPVVRFTDDDVLSEGTWLQSTSLPDYRNIVRGRYTDARSSALYQLVDWPQISLTAPDGIDRTLPVDLPAVQSVSQAQRVAKQKLQRLQAGGRADGFVFGQRAWAAQVGDFVWWTFSALGFIDKPFRVESMKIAPDGRVPMTLTEEQSAFYGWAAEDVAPVSLPTPTTYSWQNDPLVSQLGTIETGADVTLLITPPSVSVALDYDYAGAIKASQTKNIQYSLKSGAGTDVTTSASWSAALIRGSATFSIGSSTGLLSVTAVSTDAVIAVSALYLTKTRSATCSVAKTQDAPPTSGGGGTGTTASSSVISNTTASTYGSANSPDLTVTIGSAGIASLSFPADFYRTTNGTGTAAGKWQRNISGTWTDVAAEITSAVNSYTNSVDGSSDPGNLSVMMGVTGLTAGSSQSFRLLLRNGGSYTQTWSGTATVVGA